MWRRGNLYTSGYFALCWKPLGTLIGNSFDKQKRGYQ